MCERNLHFFKSLIMDDYNNAAPITPSIFVHSNPLKEAYNDFKKELRDENLKGYRQIQGDRNKETLNTDSN